MSYRRREIHARAVMGFPYSAKSNVITSGANRQSFQSVRWHERSSQAISRQPDFKEGLHKKDGGDLAWHAEIPIADMKTKRG